MARESRKNGKLGRLSGLVLAVTLVLALVKAVPGGYRPVAGTSWGICKVETLTEGGLDDD